MSLTVQLYSCGFPGPFFSLFWKRRRPDVPRNTSGSFPFVLLATSVKGKVEERKDLEWLIPTQQRLRV